MQLKSGFLTSEFWTSLVGAFIPLLVMAGIIKPSEVGGVTQLIIQAISGLVAGGVLVTYILARVDLKKKALGVEKAPEGTQQGDTPVSAVILG